MTTEKKLDWLAKEVIYALQKTGMSESWISDKENDFEGLDRLKVLRSLHSLDHRNLAAVAAQLEVSVTDLQATLRVLQKI